MKYPIIFLIVFCASSIDAEEASPAPTKEQSSDQVEQTIIELEKPQPQTVKQQDDDAKKILTTFAGMVGNFLCIVQDPNNSMNVRIQLANMLSGMITIALEMFKAGRLDEAMLEQEYHLDPELIALLKSEFLRAAHEME